MNLKRRLLPLSGRRVLITEDDMVMAMDIECTMRDAGFTIAGLASNLSMAYDVLDGGQVDFAILDVNLSGEMVFPLARRLRDLKIPFFFLTAYSREHIIPNEFQSWGCFEKPLPDSMLLDAAVQLFAVDTNKPVH